MSKHTPGPWTAIPDDTPERDWYVVTEEEDVMTLGVSEADARLISAAPDLLAVCKQMAAEAGDRDMPLTKEKVLRFVEIYADMRAAIAKAEGTS